MIGTIGIDDVCWQRLSAIDPRIADTQRADMLAEPAERVGDCTGLLISDSPADYADRHNAAVDITHQFLDAGQPVLASAGGAHILNDAFGGSQGDTSTRTVGHDEAHANSPPDQPIRTTLFLTVGSKTAMTIGGSGWLTVRDVEIRPMPIAQLSPELMPSAFTEDSAVAAFEMAGHGWAIGVSWDVADSAAMPKGFSNLLEAFVDRTED